MKLEPSAWMAEGGSVCAAANKKKLSAHGHHDNYTIPVFTLPSVLAALREHFKTKYVVGDEIYAEIDAFEKEQKK